MTPHSVRLRKVVLDQAERGRTTAQSKRARLQDERDDSLEQPADRARPRAAPQRLQARGAEAGACARRKAASRWAA